MKCVNCKHCVNFCEGYYWCDVTGDTSIEFVEEWCANDDELYCDGYEYDSNDDTTEKS